MIIRSDELLRNMRLHFAVNEQTVVTTNGCFDILHAGHLQYLQVCKSLGDILIVAVNVDHVITEIKGAGRPINGLYERMEMLDELPCVDIVTFFRDRWPTDWIRMIEPDIHVKGDEYITKEMPEREAVECSGGKVIFIGKKHQTSTTKIVEAMNRGRTRQ